MRQGNRKALVILVLSTGVNDRRLLYGCRKLPMDQSLHTANCGTIVPKVCILANREKSEISGKSSCTRPSKT